MAVAAALTLLLSACGEDARGGAGALVDARRDPPINALELEPRSGAILLSTNRGLFRIAGGSERAQRVGARVRAGRKRATARRFLTLAAAGGSRLLGSGHPDGDSLPPFLGLMTSTDGGRNWSVRSRLGLADLHVIRPVHDRVYALDAVLDGLLIGSADGRRWRELPAPGSPMLDLVVDPSDPDYLLASDRHTIYRSRDGGRTWRRAAFGRSPRLAWKHGMLIRADADGRVSKSDDRGVDWEFLSQVEGEPWKLAVSGRDSLLMALADATVLQTNDGGREWRERFRP